MKQKISLLLCLVLCITAVGCGKKETAQTPVAEGKEMPTISVFEPDVPVAPETEPENPEDILAHRRDIVEQHMRYMSTLRWSIDENVTYIYSEDGDPANTVTLVAGYIYQGIPYSHGSGNAYSWLSYATGQDENGTYTLSGLNKAALNGRSRTTVGNSSRVGNDCADTLYWAWGQVSPSISFAQTIYMTPAYGCVLVGDYEWTDTVMRRNSCEVTEANGKQRMFEAYAQLQKGDGMVHVVSDAVGGHAVMIVDVHVEKTKDRIDGDKSYVTILQQSSGFEKRYDTYFDEAIGQDVHLCETVDVQWSFNYIFDKGYLPVTCKELIDPSPLPEPEVEDNNKEPTVDNMFYSTITSNYRIASVTVTVLDAKDRPVQQATCNSMEQEFFTFALSRFDLDAQRGVLVGDIDPAALEPGQYRCTFDCRLSTGEVITFRDFTFTK